MRANITAPMGAAVAERLASRLATVEPVEVEASSAETPEQAAERRSAANGGRVRAWREMCHPKYANARLSNLHPDQYPDKAAAWLDSDTPTLFMLGGNGAGKTYTAHAIGHEAVERGLFVAVYSVPELKRMLLPGPDEDLPHRTMSRCTEWDLLILHDLGQEKSGEWVAEFLYTILEARTGLDRGAKRTIIDTNLDSTAIINRYGAAILDRIEQGAAVAKFEGRSKRRPAERW